MKSNKATSPKKTKTAPTSIRWDADVLDWLTEQSTQKGVPLTSLANSLLREAMQGGNQSLEARLTAIEKALKLKTS